MTFAEKLRRFSSDRNLSYAKIAEQGGGPSGSTVNRWANGEGEMPRIDHIAGLAKLSGYPVAYWVEDAIEDPADAGAASELAAEERSLIEKASRLGLEQAAFILQAAIEMGEDVAVSRLLALEKDRPTSDVTRPVSAGQ